MSARALALLTAIGIGLFAVGFIFELPALAVLGVLCLIPFVA